MTHSYTLLCYQVHTVCLSTFPVAYENMLQQPSLYLLVESSFFSSTAESRWQTLWRCEHGLIYLYLYSPTQSVSCQSQEAEKDWTTAMLGLSVQPERSHLWGCVVNICQSDCHTGCLVSSYQTGPHPQNQTEKQFSGFFLCVMWDIFNLCLKTNITVNWAKLDTQESLFT